MGSKITLQQTEEEKEEKEEEWSTRARIHSRFRHTNRFQKEIFNIIMSYLRLGDIHMISMTSDQFWQDISDFTKRIFILDKSHVDVSSHSDLYWCMYACESIHTIDFSHNSLINQSTILSLLGVSLIQLQNVSCFHITFSSKSIGTLFEIENCNFRWMFKSFRQRSSNSDIFCYSA